MSRTSRSTARLRTLAAAAATAAALAAVPALAPVAQADEGNPTVLAWGAGRTGQLGNGTTTDSLSPASVTSLFRGDVDQISAGGYSSSDSFVLARTAKTVKSWGNNSMGQLGNGGSTNQPVPTTVPRLTEIKGVAAGGGHALALDTSGQVYSWGDNSYGQLGNNRTGDYRTVPDRVQGMPKVKQISAGCDFSLALLENGKVYAWGRGVYGQLGNGSLVLQPTPGDVQGLARDDVKELAGGGDIDKNTFAVALLKDGTVKSWGANVTGQLGNGTLTAQPFPATVAGLSGVSEISAGGTHALAVRGGRVLGWGSNAKGQLGNGLTAADPGGVQKLPVEVQSLNKVKDVGAGCDFSAALRQDGTVWTWGEGANGRLGTGDNTVRNTPQKVKDVADIVSISVGCNHVPALTADGTVKAWGKNTEGELGNDSITDSNVAVDVAYLDGVARISANQYTNFAVLDDGSVSAWGWNAFSQLGDTTTVNRTTPVPVDALQGVTDIVGGYDYTVASLDDGSAISWGNNATFQLGDAVGQARAGTPARQRHRPCCDREDGPVHLRVLSPQAQPVRHRSIPVPGGTCPHRRGCHLMATQLPCSTAAMTERLRQTVQQARWIYFRLSRVKIRYRTAPIGMCSSNVAAGERTTERSNISRPPSRDCRTTRAGYQRLGSPPWDPIGRSAGRLTRGPTTRWRGPYRPTPR
ncbi:RCC1-like domain-containing protein [Streptomyces sp. NPDC050529]|uniref:RCC1-like domain-containing protein n=1 Tax=Streptomyces sp. NPDC050529 TaxID=3365624 RepID=UPI00378863A4